MGESPDTIAARAARWRAEFPPTAQHDFRIADCTVRVHSNSAELLERLGTEMGPYLTLPPAPLTDRRPNVTVTLLESPAVPPDVPLHISQPEAGKTIIKEELVDFPDGRFLRKRLTGLLLLFGPGDNVVRGPCLANRNQAINFINNRFIQFQLDRGHLLCHAAGVAAPHGGLALAGIAGAGKSTLALHLLSRGLNFVSNDRLLVRRESGQVEMLGVAKCPRVNPGTILSVPRLEALLTAEQRARFAALPADQLWPLEEKYDVDVPRCFGPDRVQLSARLRGIVLINWQRDGDPLRSERIALPTRRDLLKRLMKPMGQHYRVPPGYPANRFSEDDYLKLLADIPTLWLSGGVDFAGAADRCVSLLDTA